MGTGGAVDRAGRRTAQTDEARAICRIFIIALGESILLLGGTMVSADLAAPLFLTALIGFALIVGMWWTYFVHSGEAGEKAFHSAEEQTRLARAGLAYAHGIMVCGAIVVAVAIEVIVAHPTDAIYLSSILIACAGPMIFMAGVIVFRRTLDRRVHWTYAIPFVAMPLIGWAVHAAHANGIVLGLGMLSVVLPVALLNPDRGEAGTPHADPAE